MGGEERKSGGQMLPLISVLPGRRCMTGKSRKKEAKKKERSPFRSGRADPSPGVMGVEL